MKCYDLCAKVEDRQLDDFRYNAYIKKVLRPRKSAVNLASLPPTKDTATQHILRIYHQIQEWLGVNLRPERYGWTIKNSKYEPVHRLKPICPLS